MKITKAIVRRMSLDFKVGFRTSFGLSTTKDFSIVELHDSDGMWAMVPALPSCVRGTTKKLPWVRSS